VTIMTQRYKVRRLTIRKHGGDDACSWAVFVKGDLTPIVTGCSRAEARSHKESLEQMYEERAR
jgi:hypothetical protein